MRRGETALAEPFGINRRQDGKQVLAQDLGRKLPDAVEKHGTRPLGGVHDGNRPADCCQCLTGVGSINQRYRGAIRRMRVSQGGLHEGGL